MSRKTGSLRLLLPVVATTLLLAGCGEGAGPTGTAMKAGKMPPWSRGAGGAGGTSVGRALVADSSLAERFRMVVAVSTALAHGALIRSHRAWPHLICEDRHQQ